MRSTYTVYFFFCLRIAAVVDFEEKIGEEEALELPSILEVAKFAVCKSFLQGKSL